MNYGNTQPMGLYMSWSKYMGENTMWNTLLCFLRVSYAPQHVQAFTRHEAPLRDIWPQFSGFFSGRKFLSLQLQLEV